MDQQAGQLPGLCHQLRALRAWPETASVSGLPASVLARLAVGAGAAGVALDLPPFR